MAEKKKRKPGRPKGSKNKPKKKATPKKRQAKKSAPRKPRGVSRFNIVQSKLKLAMDDRGIKLGKDFNKVASRIYNSLEPGTSLSYLEENMDILYEKVGKVHPTDEPYLREQPTQAKPFKPLDNFPYYRATEEFMLPQYNGKQIFVNFSDGEMQFDFEGKNHQFLHDYLESGLNSYLRKNYNEGIYANFHLIGTDYRTYAKYEIKTGTHLPYSMVEQAMTDREVRQIVEEALREERAEVPAPIAPPIEAEPLTKEDMKELEMRKAKLQEYSQLLKEGVIDFKQYQALTKDI